MTTPTPLILGFIAFIGLAYILYTCDWKSAFQETEGHNDSHETGNNNGNSTSNFPQIAKAIATFNEREQKTIQCTNTTHTIKKIVYAKYKDGDDKTEDIVSKLQPCVDQTSCTIKTEYSDSKQQTYLVIDNGVNHTRPTIGDPSPSNHKTVDIAFSCESSEARSYFIQEQPHITDYVGIFAPPYNTISCAEHAPKNKIKIESAIWRSKKNNDKKSYVSDHLSKCNGQETCTIQPVHWTIKHASGSWFVKDEKEPKNSFHIPDLRPLPANCDKTGTDKWGGKTHEEKCFGFPDPAPGDTKEVNVVYYCRELKRNVFNSGTGTIECPEDSHGIQLFSVVYKSATVTPIGSPKNQLELCNGETTCTIIPTVFNDAQGHHNIYFQIPGKRVCGLNQDNEWKNQITGQDKDTFCSGMGDFDVGEQKEMTIEYYCD